MKTALIDFAELAAKLPPAFFAEDFCKSKTICVIVGGTDGDGFESRERFDRQPKPAQ